MLEQCDVSWETAVFNYIGDNYHKCLYLYINLLKYGFNSNHFKVWVSLNSSGEIEALLAKYYTGVHIYSVGYEYDISGIVKFIRNNQASIVTATGDIIQKIKGYLPNYACEYGSVGQIKHVSVTEMSSVNPASLGDMFEIAKLLVEDKGLGGHYNTLLLEHQLKERYIEGFGRNYIIKKDNVIVSHCATYAQTDHIAVTSGVYTKPEERGKGYAYQIYCKLCSDLLLEGKEVFAYYYTFQAHKMHEKVGFKTVSTWGKLVKI